MPAVLLVLNAFCGVALTLQPQDAVRDVSWPTHATISLPRGWVKASDKMFVLENGQPILAQIEVVAKWPDGSPKWVHAYASYRYVGGKPAKYEFEKRPKLPDKIPSSPLKVTDDAGGITVHTGELEFIVARPFAGIAMARVGEQYVLSGGGGPTLVDERGILWQAAHDETAEVTVEQQGTAQVTIRAAGWYQTTDRRVPPFCRFVTRITAFANSSILKVDHATIFADDMRKHAVAELAFRLPVVNVKGFGSSTRQGELNEKLPAVWFAQVSPNRLVTLEQRGAQESNFAEADRAKVQSGGWFSATSAGREVTLLTKDFWQKCPKEVKIGTDGITYYAWPKHGELATPQEMATSLADVYKFQCFHTGQLLDSRLPSDYFSALEMQHDTTECKAGYARAANMEGVAMHNEFALICGPEAAGSKRKEMDPARLQRLFALNPIARASPAAMALSGALGSVAAAGPEFADAEKTVHDGMLGYARSIERYEDYGWAIYGNTHHEELMNPEAAGVPGGRPSLHRVWNNNHYQHVSTSWRMFALDADPAMLQWARICTDYYASVGQVRFDGLRGRSDGKGNRVPGPEVKYHNPGAFWHCKAFVPWGCRDYGMDSNDDDSGLTGHWPDPSGLLLAWLIDGNRWAKEGYELWLKNVKFPTGGARREINTTLVHAITAYEYQPTPEILAAIQGMAKGLSSLPILEQRPGPIWEPTWLTRYYEMFPGDEAFKKYLLASADSIGVGVEGIWSLALSATAFRITKDEKYLRRHAGTLARATRQVFYDSAKDKRWDLYGFAPGPDRDGHFMLQWPWFHAALKEAKIESLPPPGEPGQYFSGSARFDNLDDIKARGTKILIWNEQPATQITIEATTLSGGDIDATHLHLLSPKGQVGLNVDRLPMSAEHPKVVRATRPSSWEVAHEKYEISPAEPGLYTALIGSHQIGVFQPLTDQPECQVLKNVKLEKWADPAWLMAKLARGYLVPTTKGRIDLTFTAMGQCDGSYISLQNPRGKPLFTRYLRAGDSVTVPINRTPETRGPLLLDAFSDHSGYFRLTIKADVDEPLMFGRRLEDIQLILRKLGQESGGR